MRTKPTTGNVGPRDPGPHGLTLDQHKPVKRTKKLRPLPSRSRDRSLAGKARIRARRDARRGAWS